MAYTFVFVSLKRIGTGQFYLASLKDKDGNSFDGAKTYRLTMPAKPPIEQYWSVTAYDRVTHALIRDMPRASRSSQITELQKNADGSVDLFFGPSAPAGKESNWVPTKPAARVRDHVPSLCPDKSVLRKDLEAARRRDHQLGRWQ